MTPELTQILAVFAMFILGVIVGIAIMGGKK